MDLDAFKEAEEVLKRVLKDYGQDPQFLQQPSGPMSLLRTRLKLAAALRGESKFDEANSLVEELLSRYPKYLEPQVEKGMLLEAEAEAKRGELGRPRSSTGRGSPASSRAPDPAALEYYDVWYHIAWVVLPAARDRSRRARRSRASCD